MESPSMAYMQRTDSQASSSSSKSRKKSTALGVKRSKSSVNSNSQPAPPSANTDKSFTSFPSFSPDSKRTLAAERSVEETEPRGLPPIPLKSQVDSRRSNPTVRHGSSIVDVLTTKSESPQTRPGLFIDSPVSIVQNVPGALHHASDDHIRTLIRKYGAIKLIRQVAEDLAFRDSEITKLRQRTERREAELKKMLRDVEVSNLSIEQRLRTLEENDTGGRKGSGPGVGIVNLENTRLQDADSGIADISSLVDEALSEELGDDFEPTENYMDSVRANDAQATIKARRATNIADSPDTGQTTQGTFRGWKTLLWSNNSSRESERLNEESNFDQSMVVRSRPGDGPRRRRTGLDDSLFHPPELQTNASRETADRASVRSAEARAVSQGTWTKLFGGKAQNLKNSQAPSTPRDRAATVDEIAVSNSRTASLHSNASQKRSSQQAKLVSGRSNIRPLKLGAPGSVRNVSTAVQPPGSPASMDAAANHGPVEMDTILPHGLRPPTLTPSYENLSDTDDYLTDNFGFIYDRSRRQKEAEAFAHFRKISNPASPRKEMLSNRKELSSIDSKTDLSSIAKSEDGNEESSARWQDYLKMPTLPAELLLSTPPAHKIMNISNPDIKKSLRRSPSFRHGSVDTPASTPNPAPSLSDATSSIAEIASPTLKPRENSQDPSSKEEIDSVKLLVDQVKELHDALQKERSLKWNEFLRKVRAERRKESVTHSSTSGQKPIIDPAMPEVKLADGEVIGIANFGIKGRTGRAKYKEFKSLVLGGIPISLRAKVWSECSGASSMRIPGYYDEFVNSGEDDAAVLTQIKMDINRTLTDNVFFRKGPGVSKLNEVLLAYARRNPEVGYCQGMNLITASLLLIMPTAEDAFWLLASIIENILPEHYYDNSLLTSQADQSVLREYVAAILPRLSAHLDDLNVELSSLTFQWFLSLFTDVVSGEPLYRIWDVLFCCKDEDGNGGSTFLFQVALALLKLNEEKLLSCDSAGEVYSYLDGEIANHAVSIDGLIRASEGLKSEVRRADVEEKRASWVANFTEQIEERKRVGTVKAGSGLRREPSLASEVIEEEPGEDTPDNLSLAPPMPEVD